jgi:hypothetical protein
MWLKILPNCIKTRGVGMTDGIRCSDVDSEEIEVKV